MNKYVVLALAGLFVAGCGGNKSYVKKGEIQQTLDQEAVSSKYIEAVGIGAAPDDVTNPDQRKAMSRNAAIVAAHYEMLSMVKGVELEGGIRVEKAMETDSLLETKIKEVIKGAEIIKTEYTQSGGAVVTTRLPKHRLESMMGIKFK